MATDGGYVDFVLDCMAGLGPVRAVRFFSGTGLVIDGVQFAMITGSGRLFFVVDDATRPRYRAAGMEPFSYMRRTGRREIQRWYELPEDVLTDADELRRWAGDAIRIAATTRRPKRATRKAVASGKQPAKAKPKRKEPKRKQGAG
jgi:DNA transformation protein